MATNAAPDPSRDSGASGEVESASTTAVVVCVVGLPPRKLSEVLRHIIESFHERPVTLREVIVLLEGRAYTLLMLLLALPFFLPVPMPGLSSVLGTVIAVIALRMTLGQTPWLPARLLDREMPAKFFPTLLSGASRVLRFLEVMLKPRLLWLTAAPLLRQLHALVILIAAFVLLLPLPPGTNLPPALCIVIMAGGLLERDGRFILAGYGAFLINVVFFGLLWIYGERLVHWVLHLFSA